MWGGRGGSLSMHPLQSAGEEGVGWGGMGEASAVIGSDHRSLGPKKEGWGGGSGGMSFVSLSAKGVGRGGGECRGSKQGERVCVCVCRVRVACVARLGPNRRARCPRPARGQVGERGSQDPFHKKARSRAPRQCPSQAAAPAPFLPPPSREMRAPPFGRCTPVSRAVFAPGTRTRPLGREMPL